MTAARTSLRVVATTLLLASLAGSNAFAQVPAGMVRIEGSGDGPVPVQPFALDTVPVSLAALLGQRADGPAARKPATRVTWHAAAAFCRARGARLPTTHEWEFAARASETERNAAASATFRQRALRLALSADPASFRIGSGFRNVWGVYDLQGGVMEWTQDFDGGHGAHGKASTCGAGTAQGGDARDYAAFLRFSFRAALTKNTTADNLSFRCAASLDRS